MTTLLTCKRDVMLDDVVSQCAALGLDAARIRDLALTATRHAKSGGSRSALDELEHRWYASLAAGAPDFSVYESELYIAEAWSCWVVYSRRYLRDMADVRDTLGPVGSVIDLGCGVGLTTSALKQLFPQAAVHGVDFGGTAQAAIARNFASRFDFALTPLEQLTSADLIFASEFFEHIEAPIAYLRDILERFTPHVLVIANSFNTKAIGHFTAYSEHDERVPAGRMSRLFNAELRLRGYRQATTKFWNNRPVIWCRAESLPTRQQC